MEIDNKRIAASFGFYLFMIVAIFGILATYPGALFVMVQLLPLILIMIILISLFALFNKEMW